MQKIALSIVLSAFMLPLFSQPCLDLRFPENQAGGVLDLKKNAAGNYILLNREGPGAFMEISKDGQLLKTAAISSHYYKFLLPVGDRYITAGSFSSVGCSDPDVQGSYNTVAALDADGNTIWKNNLEIYQYADQAATIALLSGNGADDFYIATNQHLYHINTAGLILEAVLLNTLPINGVMCHLEKNADGGFDAFYTMPDKSLKWARFSTQLALVSEKNMADITANGSPEIRKVSGGGWTITLDRVGNSPIECRFFRLNAEADVLWSGAISVQDNAYFGVRSLTQSGNEFWLIAADQSGLPSYYRFDANGATLGHVQLNTDPTEKSTQLRMFSPGGQELIIAGDYRYLENNSFKTGSRLVKFGCAASTGTISAADPATLQVFPNPAGPQFRLQTTVAGPHKWEIFNLQGRLLEQGILNGVQEITTESFGRGTVMLRVTNEKGQVLSRKIVLE